jgi:hypothetical protein
MKYPKAYLNYINKLVELFRARALLMEYEPQWKAVGHLKDKRYPEGYTAEIDVDTRYLEFEVNLGAKFYQRWKKKEYRQMAELMAHELSHVYTEPYAELFEHYLPPKAKKQLAHINEQQTERLSKLIMLNIKPKDYLP